MKILGYEVSRQKIKDSQSSNKTEKQVEDALINSLANLGYGSKLRQGYYGSDIHWTRNWVQLDSLYRSNWLAQRIINLPALDMTREWTNLLSEIDPVKIEKIQAYESKLNIKKKFTQGIKWARLYGGALGVMNFGDTSDPSRPLNPASVSANGLKSVHVFARWQITVGGELVKDMEDSEYGLPEYYIVNGMKIHHTRCLRFISHELPWRQLYLEQYWGAAELERVLQALLRYDTTADSSSDLVFLAAQRYVKIIGYRDAAAKGQMSKVISVFNDLANLLTFNRIALFDSKDELINYDYKFTGLKDLAEMFMMDVSGASEIPTTKLFGRSPAGLNSTGDSDIRNYYDDCKTKQEDTLRPPLAKCYRVLVPSAIGEYPADFAFEFNNLWQESDKETADIQLKQAQADQIYMERGVLSESDIAKELRQRGTYKNITADKMLDAEEDSEEETETEE